MAARQSLIDKGKEYLSSFQNQGITRLSELIVRDLNAWKNETINIAVIGQSGAGKSSLINAILGLSAEDTIAAEVNLSTKTTTCTSEPKPYSHPQNRHFTLWDCPGIGIKNIPKESYLDQIGFRKFDFFIIVACKRFSENDAWLACELDEMNKHFYFVRTKVDNDVENKFIKFNQNQPIDKVKEDVVAELMDDCKKNLETSGSKMNIFLIDSYDTNEYHFDDLQRRIIRDCLDISKTKKDAITLTLSAITKPAIEEKKIILEKRISGIALRAAFAPRLYGSDVRILEEEVEFYIKQFNLDAKSLEKAASTSNIRAQLSHIEAQLHMDRKAEEKNIADELDQLIPFIPFINVVKTYKAGKVWLKKILDMAVDSAVEVNKTIIIEGLATC